MKLFQRITLALMGCMLLSTPAMAADYSFETKAPADYYGSTAYEEVYGAQYNYGGQNAVDFLDPLADSAPSPLAGNTIEYGIGSSSGSIYPDGTSNDYPLQWGGPSVTPVTAFTPVSDVEQANGSIGTLSIPSLGIRYIDASLIECYRRKGITFDNSTLYDQDGALKEMPVIEDWYDVLMDNPETKHLAVVLTRYVSGSAAAMGGRTNVDTDNPYLVIDLTDLPDDLILPSVYAATGFATDVIVQNGDVGTALLSDELWKLLGANSNPLAADYTMRMVKLIRSQGGIAGVTSQGMADMMALDGGKYGKAILDSCRIKFIMQMEEQEARLVQNILNLTEEEVRLITRFRRGEGLLCIGHNHVPISVFVSPKEYEAITTSPTDRRARNNA